ncbi:endonuclease [Neolewinella agarilytica]|uniref:endonuclease n=1 Tax=Neolewinella agarilytica TaxID=478744 RepID=UPI002354CBEC|nr:endonuclease [Neolewinella agarilytica]
MHFRFFLIAGLMALCTTLFAQSIPSYYDDVNLNLTGQSLQTELSDKVTTSQFSTPSYTPGVWDALKQTDLDPNNSSRVILIYGYSDTDGVSNTDRTRSKDSNGGGTTDWNREHTYPKSLGNPNLGTSGPGADVHHLRPSDVSRNSSRGSRKFADGSGNSGITSQGHWYPGDEFKGDVARMMMYMYLRYGNRCLPSNVGIGTTNSSDANMLNLFLEWNAEDPVSALELQRNPIVETIQGNRNPFIDNPAFATSIWGGPQAEDRFGSGGGGGGGNTNPFCNSSNTVTSFPYAESFESDFGNWVQASAGDDFNWVRRSGSTPSSGTGPSSASAGSSYAYMESSTPNYSTKRAIMYGPCFDLSGKNTADFSFKYHMYGASNMGSLALEASTDGSSWTSVWSRSGNQGNSWQSASVDLDTYLGGTVQLRFNGVTGTTWKGDMAIDELGFSTSASGGGGGGGNVAGSLSITLDNYPEETSWVIRNSSNVTVFSGGTYGNRADGSTFTVPVSLAPGCYTLVFSDTYGDGMCCSYGNGSYTLTNQDNGSTLASGGSFGSSETSSFCVGSSLQSAPEATDAAFRTSGTGEAQAFSLFPNPVGNQLSLRNFPEEAEYRILNASGQLVQQGRATAMVDVSNLPSGAYQFMAVAGDWRVVKRVVKQ